MTGCAWMWLYCGAFLMLLEIASPGFVIFFFGLSAATVGFCRFALGDAFTMTWQFAAFSLFSVLYLAVLRRGLKRLFSGDVSQTRTDFRNDFVGRTGTVTVAIEPPQTGRVQIGDAEWTALSATPIPVGTTVKVTAQDNLSMTVAPL